MPEEYIYKVQKSGDWFQIVFDEDLVLYNRYHVYKTAPSLKALRTEINKDIIDAASRVDSLNDQIYELEQMLDALDASDIKEL